ncbi:Cell surface antigen-like protein Sca10 [Rickettsia akari str. Hartford]|uniref:Cell surface antigen-like protein Sca10 n=1 Tax=Rickettsia akari (strain Hartford) TaxID=293614 RepID=A8GLU1_RICAH|nr:Cell surface antigen-like protein Sca10 [Rickettsia akari str. Hartford]
MASFESVVVAVPHENNTYLHNVMDPIRGGDMSQDWRSNNGAQHQPQNWDYLF